MLVWIIIGIIFVYLIRLGILAINNRNDPRTTASLGIATRAQLLWGWLFSRLGFGPKVYYTPWTGPGTASGISRAANPSRFNWLKVAFGLIVANALLFLV